MMGPTIEIQDALIAGAGRARRLAAGHVAGLQNGDGHWCAELTADTTLESDFILLQLWLYPPENGAWKPATRGLVDKAVRTILARQLPDGGFNIYAGGPADVSATVKAYFALKLAGVPAEDPRLARARERILDLGGIQAANSYVKINLSLFGLYPREGCPTVPPEVMLLPGNFLYRMSSWTRAIVVPVAIVQALNAGRPVPEGFTLAELFKPGVSASFRRSPELVSWRNLFLAIDWGLKRWEKYGARMVRERALREAEKWMLQRFERSDGLGAIYPPMMYAIMALDLLGYSAEHPVRREALRQFDNLMTDDGERFFFEPCFSPLWDTAMAAYALGISGEAAGEVMRGAADWLVAREIRRRGDWSVMRPHTEPSGWAFEYRNDFYPDIDDTAMVLLALKHARATDAAAQEAARRRAVAWLLDMQGSDGGWAAFDVDNNWEFLSNVPFADHNAMLDPTCPDITGRVMEGLVTQGVPRSHAAIRMGRDYLVKRQEADGSWYGRWGVAYIYGTCFALRGLAAAGESDREAHVLRAAEWLRSIQNADGGWGESCASYDNGCYTPAPSTPSQTAWALMGLLAAGDTGSRTVLAGVEHLIETQNPDGSWNEEVFTGSGFPRVFYLMYHMYRDYFPLMALSLFLKAREGNG